MAPGRPRTPLACATILAAMAAQCWGADWLRIRTPHLEVLTDAGEKTGRSALNRLEDIRRVLDARNTRPLPLRVFVFASEKEFRAYAENSIVDGFYQSGVERDFIVLHAGANLSREVAHEYIHWIMDRGLPLWFEEGTAELYSNLDFQRGQTIAGAPIPRHLATLASQPWLTAGELLRASRASPFYGEQTLAGVFYAESWALAHMLNLAPGWRDEMPVFAAALASGGDQDEAFRAAFGKTMEQAVAELRLYVGRLHSVSLDAAPQLSPDRQTTERITPIEGILARADLALHVHNIELARAWFENAEKLRPDSPEAESGLGTLALAEGRRDRAKAHFERAIDMGSKDPAAYFELAMLLRESGSPARVGELLARAITADPNFGEAHFILGTEATDDGDYEAAIDHLRAATRAMPARSYVWYALAFAQMKLGQIGEARASAARALRTAATPEEEGMAAALWESMAN